MSAPTVVAGVDVEAAEVVTMLGETLPITDWADVHGELCAPADARYCVAGPDLHGRALTIDIPRLSVRSAR